MDGMRKILVNFYENSPILQIYRKLSQIYDPSRWSLTYHYQVHMDVVDWLYYSVIVQLALNKELPLHVRYMTKREFISARRPRRSISFANTIEPFWSNRLPAGV